MSAISMPGRVGRSRDGGGDVGDGVAEDFLALHAQMAGGLGRGWAAIDIEHVVQPAVREQLGVEHALVGIVALAVIGLQHHRAGAVAEQHAGGAVGPVQQPAHAFGADQKNGAGLAAADEIVGHRQAIDEAGANRLHVEGGAVRHAQPRLHHWWRWRERFRPAWWWQQMMMSISPASMPASASAARAARQRQIGGLLAVR